MAATAPTEVFRPAGSICCSDQPPASNDVESCSAPLRGLAVRCQKWAVLFPRRHGLPTCENCAWGALGGRQQRARFAHLGLRTASPAKLSIAYWPPRSRRSLVPCMFARFRFHFSHIVALLAKAGANVMCTVARARGGEGPTWGCTMIPLLGDTYCVMQPQVSLTWGRTHTRAAPGDDICVYVCRAWEQVPSRVMGLQGHGQSS